MHWYEAEHEIDGVKVTLHGIFKESQLKIYAILDFPDETTYQSLYHKTVSLWAHQEVLAEDVLAKYEGTIKKCEQKLPIIVEKAKVERRI